MEDEWQGTGFGDRHGGFRGGVLFAHGAGFQAGADGIADLAQCATGVLG